MSLSKIAIFAFGLAAVLGAGFSQANAAPRTGYTSVHANSYAADVDAARYDRAKGIVQGY